MKSEALTGGVLQFRKIHNETSVLKSLFNKDAGLMVCNFIKKKPPLAQVFSCKFSEIFKKTYFVEHVRTDAWVKWTKSIHRKTPVMAFFLVQLQTWALTVFSKGTPSQMLFYENCAVLHNIIFRKQCCATASYFLWHFQCITCTDKSVQS